MAAAAATTKTRYLYVHESSAQYYMPHFISLMHYKSTLPKMPLIT
jgi:hypothetical protein